MVFNLLEYSIYMYERTKSVVDSDVEIPIRVNHPTKKTNNLFKKISPNHTAYYN